MRYAGCSGLVPRARVLSPVLALAGCSGPQSTLDAHGPVALGIATAWWIMAIGAALILSVVMTLVLYAALRAPARRRQLAIHVFLALGGVLFPTVVLAALLIYGTDLGRRITQAAPDALRIEVTAHRWWWDVHYPASEGHPAVRTANELHLPTGRPVHVTVHSADVIHSFWIPSLAGKVDMIPGMVNGLRFTAAAEGTFRGQCAEFCGAQHAHMGFIVTVEPPARFTQWRQRRARPVAAVADGGITRFLELGCGDCHRIDGTAAAGEGGPVLTHFAGRPSLGAATVRLDAAALRAWLADHGRSLKPGSPGPRHRRLEASDVERMAKLLESLH